MPPARSSPLGGKPDISVQAIGGWLHPGARLHLTGFAKAILQELKSMYGNPNEMFRGVSVMKLLNAVLLCAVVWNGTQTTASAADIDVLQLPGIEQVFMFIKGEIVEGDANKFYENAEGIERATVVLSGPGGLVGEALSIGAEVHDRNFATMVAPEDECFSACALIWIASKRRYLSKDSMIGVHAVYRTGENGVQVSGVGNAEVGAYLAMVELRIEAIRYFTLAPPEAFLPITPAIARLLGIDVYEQDGFEVTTPGEAPSVDRVAFKVARLLAFSTTCSGLFEIDSSPANDTGAAELRRGHEEFGGAAFAEIIPLSVYAAKKEIGEKGAIRWCVDAVNQFAQEDVYVGLDGPSFDCRKASYPTETTICEYVILSALDRLNTMLYKSARSISDAVERGRILQEQRAFLKSRNACMSDSACIERLYRSRIIALAQ